MKFGIICPECDEQCTVNVDDAAQREHTPYEVLKMLSMADQRMLAHFHGEHTLLGHTPRPHILESDTAAMHKARELVRQLGRPKIWRPS